MKLFHRGLYRDKASQRHFNDCARANRNVYTGQVLNHRNELSTFPHIHLELSLALHTYFVNTASTLNSIQLPTISPHSFIFLAHL